MIDQNFSEASNALFWFHAKQAFWLFMFPVILGFVSIAAMRIYMLAGMSGSGRPLTAFFLSAPASMVSLFGWRLVIARTSLTIVLYGCGVGLAAALMSRIGAITMSGRTFCGIRTIRIVWRSDRKGLEELKRRLHNQRIGEN